jgi:histidinol-phosphate phosphatase family protein
MTATSLALPFAATAQAVAGHVRARGLRRCRARYDAVLLDRDGTLVVDVPYNGDPERVEPLPGVAAGLDRLRQAGLLLAGVSNQSGVARGLIERAQVDAVNARVESVVGPLEGWFVCPHGPDDGCGCRKPAPGLVRRAAATLGTSPERCLLVGDIGSDVGAAVAAGAAAILVPTAATRHEEIADAAARGPAGQRVGVAATFADAVSLVLRGGP